MFLPDLPQLINLDLSEDEIVLVDGPECGLNKTLNKADFGELFRFVFFLFAFLFPVKVKTLL